MAQFDVVRSPRTGTYPFLIDIQADLHSKLGSRLVLPLVARALYNAAPITRLTPIVSVRGELYVAIVPAMATIPKASLGAFVESLAAQRATLIAAIDLLVTGS